MDTARNLPVVAVDGPAGSGKSSVSRGVATRLGLRYLDTGAMYRAVTWAALQAAQAAPEQSDAALTAAARGAVHDLVVGTDPSAPVFRIDGHDVTAAIRTPEVTRAVSRVSALPEVREALVARQRAEVAAALAAGVGVVVEGRDIGTVVLPAARLKVFLTADPEVRARRRAAEVDAEVAATAADLRRRDAIDTGRAASPLRPADDAVPVDATELTLPQVIERVVGLVRERW